MKRVKRIGTAKQLREFMDAAELTPVYNTRRKVNDAWFQLLLTTVRQVAGFQINTNNARQWLNNGREGFTA